MKSYYGNYLGVVITGGDKDPEHRGRTQVFVPNIMPALYENWNEPGEDITFEVIGQGLDGSLNPQIVDRLRNILPWAECAAPITGAAPSYGAGIGGFVSETIRNVGKAAEAVGGFIGDVKDRVFGGVQDSGRDYTSNENPWSAAFISYAAGTGDPSFPRNHAHTGYAADVRKGKSANWEAVDPRTTELKPGDIVINNRGGNFTYDDFQSGKTDDKSSHGDIVVSVSGGKAQVVGGNVRQKVSQYSINASGNKAFVVLRPKSQEIANKVAGNAMNELGNWQKNGWTEGSGGARDTLNAYWQAGDRTKPFPDTALAGQPNESNSALPNPQATTNMGPFPTKEQEAATALDSQQKVELGMQSSPQQMSLGGTSSGLPPGVSKNDLIMAMRIAGAESGFGVPGSAIGRETGDLGLQAANAFGWGYYDKQYGFDHKKYFPGNKRTAAQGLAFIKDYPQMAFKIDTGLIQANQDDARKLGLKVDGDSTAQIYSLASLISKQRAADPKLNELIEGGQFDAIHNYKNSKGVWGGIPGYNLKKEHELSGINSYPKTMAELAKYGGDPEAMLADWAKKVPSTPSIQEMMGADYKAPAYDTGVAANQPIIQNPTPHHGISGPNTNNQALGMFGYASEGQSVWVFFREGNPLCPVYFAASYGNKEWGNMYQNASNAFGSGTPGTLKMQSMFYGGGFNSSLSTNESEMGQGHSFQLFDNNGSNLTFAKDHTQFNSMYNHVQRVMGDSHDITETNKEVRVKGNYNTFTEQDMFITIGNWTDDAIAASDEIQSYINEAMEIKAKAGKS